MIMHVVKIKLINTIFLIFSVMYLQCLPLNSSNEPMFPSSNQIRFMQRFGYLGGGDFGQAQYSQNTIQIAVLNLQKFGGINMTGILDDETAKLMTKRRCGVKDIVENQRIRRYATVKGWKKRVLTYFIANWNSKLGKSDVKREITKAFDVWAPYGKLKFINIEEPSADIIIAFARGPHGDQYPFDGQGGVLAHAFFPNELNFGGDMHFDDEEPWSTTNEEDSTDFFSVAVHELGHVLGLSHSHVPTSVMFPYYRNTDNPSSLDYDDVMGMYKLYIENKFFDREERTTAAPESEPDSTCTEEPNETTQIYVTTKKEISTITEQYHYTITYDGDVETVDDHKKHDTTHTISENEPDNRLCNGFYDFISVLRQELFIFKGNQVWRLKSRAQIDGEYPVKIEQIFGKLPHNVTKIDAAYENLDGNIILFTGKEYWVYEESHFIEKTGSLKDYGIPDSVTNIDAIQVWPKNERTYLFKDDYFWRFDEKSKTLDPGYPKNISRWRGIPPSINGAFTWQGDTYFFKKLMFWRFDNIMIKANENYPLPVVQYWFGCPETEDMFQLVENYNKN